MLKSITCGLKPAEKRLLSSKVLLKSMAGEYKRAEKWLERMETELQDSGSGLKALKRELNPSESWLKIRKERDQAKRYGQESP